MFDIDDDAQCRSIACSAVPDCGEDDGARREARERDLEPVPLRSRVVEQQQLPSDRADGDVDPAA